MPDQSYLERLLQVEEACTELVPVLRRLLQEAPLNDHHRTRGAFMVQALELLGSFANTLYQWEELGYPTGKEPEKDLTAAPE